MNMNRLTNIEFLTHLASYDILSQDIRDRLDTLIKQLISQEQKLDDLALTDKTGADQ